MAYRKAKSIELHETNTIITLSAEGYIRTTPAARHEQASRAAFSVRLADINRLAERFGVKLQGPTRKLEDLQDAVLPILRNYYEVPSDGPGIEISSLECDVISANLVEIRIEARREGAETASFVETITHSGSFTIWWAAEQPASAEQLFAVAEAHPTIPLEAEIPETLEDIEPDVGVLPPKQDTE